MSLMDSVMFGEGFDDGGTTACANRESGECGDADWMLLATSGLQFGTFNDMLTDINLFRGMVFGMWGRPPYCSAEQNRHLWEWIDSSGLSANATEMLGYWADQDDWKAVVHSSVSDIKATAYLVQPMDSVPGSVIIAVASWAQSTVSVALTLDERTIASKVKGWSAAAKAERPAIPMVQNASAVSLDSLTLAPRAGALLVVHG